MKVFPSGAGDIIKMDIISNISISPSKVGNITPLLLST
jgi:hypothetical protein